MRRWPIVVSISLCSIVLIASSPPAQRRPGAVVAVGGGGTTDAILRKTLDLAGGPAATVAILPQASAESTGEESAQMWRDAGAREVRIVDFKDAAGAKAWLEQATLIWMPGGDQNRFMKAIVGTGLDDAIRARHRAGAVVGGTSAGAAVLSRMMITGDADLDSLASARTVTAAGLGLLANVIVDQHFLRRQRHNRLISLVLDHPALVGVGIDEATAAIVQGSTITVLGRSAVMIVDARKADVSPAASNQPVAARNVRLTILRDGMSASLR
jgi:cyanophycinase